MKQPDKEKGDPIDNPTGEPMPEPTIFTDGNKYANYFVRELYLGFNWGDFSYKQYDGLYLHHERYILGPTDRHGNAQRW